MPFARILRSTALLAKAGVVTAVAAAIRAKFISWCFGAAGIGFIGILNAFSARATEVGGWGLGTSAVRTVAGADALGKKRKEAAVRKFGRRLAAVSLVGVILFIIPAGYLYFVSQEHAVELLVVGLAVPCMVATAMWTSLLQASGQIGALVRTQIIAAVGGLIAGLPLIYFFGNIGIAISILWAAALAGFMSWRAARLLVPPSEAVPLESDIRELMQLGLIFQIGLVLGVVASVTTTALIVRHYPGWFGASALAHVGYFLAALALTNSVPALIFQVTQMDFYPRVAAARDENEARHITEKQVQACLLLATPLIMGILTMGPLALTFFYTAEFAPAVPSLNWLAWTIFFNMLGSPLGFWVNARGSLRAVAAFQALVSVMAVLLAVGLVPTFGIEGAAVAQAVGALFFAIVLLIFTRRSSGQWLGAKTWLWLAVCGVALGLGSWLMTKAPSPYWGLLPTTLTAALCVGIYFKIIAKERHADELA